MTNPSILKMVVSIIGLVLIISMICIAVLVFNDKSVPDIFQIVAVSGITGLLGLLGNNKDTPNPNS